MSHNVDMAADGQATFGFQGASSGAFAKPTAFNLNGTACTTV
ncbi:cellulose binding domain-containing protein [Streptomyces sp. NBC_00576]|nr:cellulose binding domain-containing protein [Streptomyces sp. NBC_00576]WUB68878.1 cellulose-binding domain-containing protein [Streptomyces sp. NBC_00576]